MGEDIQWRLRQLGVVKGARHLKPAQPMEMRQPAADPANE
jgi:hypothetical protein